VPVNPYDSHIDTTFLNVSRGILRARDVNNRFLKDKKEAPYYVKMASLNTVMPSSWWSNEASGGWGR
jgi:hypothetical protein